MLHIHGKPSYTSIVFGDNRYTFIVMHRNGYVETSIVMNIAQNVRGLLLLVFFTINEETGNPFGFAFGVASPTQDVASPNQDENVASNQARSLVPGWML